MNRKKKPASAAEAPVSRDLPVGMQPTRERPKRASDRKRNTEGYTPMEAGQPDPTPVPGLRNPRGLQSGRGPLNEEGEGDRQNDQLAELEQVEPDLELDK